MAIPYALDKTFLLNMEIRNMHYCP